MRKGRAVAIVLKDNELLLVMHRNNEGREYYVLPGGGIETGETPEQAAVREVEEEASLKIEIAQQIYEHHYDDGSNQYFFLCRYISGDPKLSANAPELNEKYNFFKPLWLPISKLGETLLYPLEIRDWIIEDLKTNFPKKVRSADLKIAELRQSL